MKLTGQKLREKRETMRLTISEVSLATKINPKVLCAMEGGDFEHLPAKTFLRGFVRSYANFLKMNVEETLALFSQEVGEAQKETAEPESQEPTASQAATVDVNGEGSGTLRMFIVGGILVLIVLIIGVRSLIQKYERERTVESSAEITKATVTPVKTEEPVTPPPAVASAPVAPVELPVAKLEAPKPEPIKVEPIKIEPVKIEPVKIEAPKVEVKKEVHPKVEVAAAPALPEPKPASAPEAADAPAPPKPEKKSAKSHREIILEALDKVDVKFLQNGQSKTLSLAPNQVHTIYANGPVQLDLSDGGAVNIIENGQDKGPPGDLGHPKQVTIP